MVCILLAEIRVQRLPPETHLCSGMFCTGIWLPWLTEPILTHLSKDYFMAPIIFPFYSYFLCFHVCFTEALFGDHICPSGCLSVYNATPLTTLCVEFLWNSVGSSCKILWVEHELRENWRNDIHTLLVGVKGFLDVPFSTSWQICMPFCTGDFSNTCLNYVHGMLQYFLNFLIRFV